VPEFEVIHVGEVNITPQLKGLVRAKAATGMYNSASEVVRDALRLMAQHDQVQSIKLEQLRQDIQLQLNSGEPSKCDNASIKHHARL
jgi:antitoxin ParD1/3/4